ncbi:hypothetical protein [Thiococcus pfennigii]|uniref:hypothetical protein n=1 Tax=Thiococcus pfennigii TaxID=1057 RepID=UPI001907A2CE|nr:hypothetical protein [Thiococcus pfennigii]
MKINKDLKSSQPTSAFPTPGRKISNLIVANHQETRETAQHAGHTRKEPGRSEGRSWTLKQPNHKLKSEGAPPFFASHQRH